MIHGRLPAPPPRSAWMEGSAVTTTRASRVIRRQAPAESSTVSRRGAASTMGSVSLGVCGDSWRVGPGSGCDIRFPLSSASRGSPAYTEADGRYDVNWACADRPVLPLGFVYLFRHTPVGGVREGRGENKGDDMDTDLLSLARAGDEDAFGELVAPYHHELQVHCYRILGSLHDAEDALQETLLSAWRGLDGFEGRSSVRTWLYRIATNRSLDAIRASARRDEPMTTRINGLVPPAPTHRGEVPWLTPYPDDLLDQPDPTPGPEAVVESHEATSLAFVTALQLLPPKQRAVLILRDVLGYRAAEAAEVLDTTVESVTSALKRARATLEADETLAERRTQPPAPTAGSPEERQLIEAYVDAFTTHDVEKLVAILSEDVWLKMPPLPLEYHGRDAAIGFFQAVVHPEGRPLRLVPTRANGCPASGVYAHDPATETWRATGLIVVGISGDRITELTRFEAGGMASFGLPRILG